MARIMSSRFCSMRSCSSKSAWRLRFRRCSMSLMRRCAATLIAKLGAARASFLASLMSRSSCLSSSSRPVRRSSAQRSSLAASSSRKALLRASTSASFSAMRSPNRPSSSGPDSSVTSSAMTPRSRMRRHWSASRRVPSEATPLRMTNCSSLAPLMARWTQPSQPLWPIKGSSAATAAWWPVRLQARRWRCSPASSRLRAWSTPVFLYPTKPQAKRTNFPPIIGA